MSNNESIKDTLDVIRRALEDKDDFTEKNDNILILNNVIDKKLDDLMEKKMTAMLKNQLPIILDNYFKNKK